MDYRITHPGFQNYTGPLGKTEWVEGKCSSITDPLDADMIRITLGIELAEIPETSPADNE